MLVFFFFFSSDVSTSVSLKILLIIILKNKIESIYGVKNGYFGSQKCDFFIDKSDIPKNTIFYINQAYSCSVSGKKLYDLFLYGQIVPYQPYDSSEYDMREDVELLVPEFDINDGFFF